MLSVMLRVSVLALVLIALPSVARADIYMWRDPHGVKHYTNAKGLVPADAGASVVLEEPPQPPAPDAAAAPLPVPSREVKPAADAENVFDRGAMAAAYAAGWQQGIAAAQQIRAGAPAPAAAPVSIQFNAPLAVAASGGGGYAPSWWDYNYPALVTTSFDNGRSRHLTMRMLLQDQFAIDRDGPYLIVDRFPPLGPNLQTVLPRGLPFLVNGRVGNRVLIH